MATKLEVIEREDYFAPDGAFDGWLVEDGVTVAWIHGIYNAEKVMSPYGYVQREEGCWLHDIETRPEHQNKGYAKKLLEMTAKHFEVESVQHSGGYTPEGWEFISRHVSRPANATKVDGPGFRSMTFVTDWEMRYAP